MPTPDPVPPLAALRRRFLRIMRLGALFSIVIAAIGVALVTRGDSAARIHMLIATALGIGLSVLLGIALMSPLFLSNRYGQDIDAAGPLQKEENDPRP